MNLRCKTLRLSVAIAFALCSGVALAATPPMASPASVSPEMLEARQESQIWTIYALSPYLRANDLKVSVHRGKATLSGSVEEGINKELAQEIALGVSGIKQVDNQIAVTSDYVPSDSSMARSYGETIDDSTITAVVKSKLTWSKYTSGLTTKVETHAGKVTLSGNADSSASRELAGRVAMNSRGVRSVNNLLVVNGAKPSLSDDAEKSMHEASREIKDSWITTKVKSTFMYSNHVDGSDIVVKTDAGIVTLSGTVDSAAQRALAIELAGNVRGVRSVSSAGLKI